MKITKLTHALGVILLTCAVGSSPIVYADDTELYLGELAGNIIPHNVLFVLDTSLSMKSKISSTGKSRIDTLREAMDTLVAGLDNVNVGIMRMNGTKNPENNSANRTCGVDEIAAGGQKYGSNSGNWWRNVCYMPTGGTVLFPVANLDAPLTDLPSEGGRSEVTSAIIAGDDDATQTVAATNATTTGQVLEIAYQQCAPSDQVTLIAGIDDDDHDDSEDLSTGDVRDNNTIDMGSDPSGFIFTFDGNGTGVLPALAPIVSATIEFTARTDGGDDIDTELFGELNVKPDEYDDGPDNISNRTPTAALVSWPGVQSVSAEEKFSPPDVTAIVQEIVNLPGWNDDLTVAAPSPSDGDEDLLNIMISGDDGGFAREIYARDLSNSKSAKLTVTYCANTTFPAATKQRVGLRFQDVRIPQGATIEEATIDFTAASPNLNQNGTSGTDSVTIYAHNTDDADDFNPSSGTNISSRAATSNSESWTVDQMGTWQEGVSYSTPDLSAVVQEVTDRGGWCGGNDIAVIFEGDTTNVMRAAQSFEAGAPPVLRVAYSATGITGTDTGCNVKQHSVPVAQSNHDARMATNGTMKLNLNGLPMGNNSEFTIGTIFKVPVSPGSTILSARLVFTATGNATASGLSPLIVNAEATDDAADFSTTSNDMSTGNRPRVSGSGIPVTADVPTAAEGTPFPVDPSGNVGFDVTPLVTEIAARAGWAYDNKMAFFVTNGATNIYRQARSWDGNPSQAPRLVLEVQEDTASTTARTVRDRLFEINDTLKASNLLGWTPSTETLLEAAYYWRSKPVRFGAQRGLSRIVDSSTGTLGTAHGIDYTQWTERTLISHPDSHTGGTYTPAGCEFEYTNACEQDLLSGATYVSPFRTGLECSQNYMIFLTDGAPTFVNNVTEDEVIAEFPDITSCSTDGSYNAKGDRGRCAREIIEELHTKDQDDTMNGDQTVETHTIAFNLNDGSANTWLQQLATGGGGNFYTAETAAELLGVFDQIFGEIFSAPRSFAAPSISANAFNRLFTRDEAYFGLFLPDGKNRWSGNVKKYKLCVDSTLGGTGSCTLGDILDANNNPAIDSSTEKFDTDALSLWTAGDPDGLSVEKGGAGAEITDFNQRTIYTDVAQSAGLAASGTALTDSGYEINSSLWNSAETQPTRDAVCPNPSIDTSTPEGQDCEDRMLWMLGKDVLDQDTDGSTTDTRWWMHDVLHSSPVTATYGKDGSTFIDKVIVGTNAGALQMINSDTGVEEWAFYPNSLLNKQIALFDNTGAHEYGMDATPVLRVNDVDNDGTIEPSDGDFIHVVVAQRRGGNDIFALDITPDNTMTSVSDTIVPKFLWRIEGGVSGDFERMGLSFSDPTLARIAVPGPGGTTVGKDVYIFGGGYDVALDGVNANGDGRVFGTAAGDPNEGNAIYVVDADSGDRILWISSSANSSNGDAIQVTNMKYSIPSELKVFDSDGDGYDDRFYVGDAGGQVWRVDLAGIDPSGLSPKGDTTVGRLASISTAGGTPPVNERRFFYPPSVVQVLDTEFSNATNGEYDYILLGTGNRANPTDTNVQDRFYAFRDTNIGPMVDSDNNNLADDYPRAITVATSNSGPIDNGDLEDVTSSYFDPTSADLGFLNALGWYIDLSDGGNAGEKVLAAADVNNGILIFTSYLPGTADPDKPCDPVEGNGKAYNLDILSTRAAIDWDSDDPDYNPVSGRSEIVGVGIPSGAIAVFTNEGVTVLVGTGDSAKNLGKVADTPRYETYWNQE